VLGPEYPYLGVIGALMYLANNTRPNITFVVNCLVRHSAALTMRHCNDIKNILRYLHGTTYLGLFFRKNQDYSLIRYTDAVYLFDPQNVRSQIGYIFFTQRGCYILEVIETDFISNVHQSFRNYYDI
jgi:hypothetical protein